MSMTEAYLTAEVRRLVGRYQLIGYHVPDSRRATAAGFPDWVIVGPGGVLWRELKSPYGSLSSGQTQWRYALAAAGQDWGIWRPLDLESGIIAQELQALARPNG